MRKSGIVKIIGAGPGDPELLTVKAALALQNADVVLYDALVSLEIIEQYTSGGCKCVYVGKRKGKKEFNQDEINELIVFYAKKFSNVVRLKGGDPFVFGRGHEEMEYIASCGIEVEYIPGISSAIAAPAAAGIPVTKRAVSQSVWILTGTQADGSLPEDIYAAAKTSATVVILMGVTKLSLIAQIFSEARGEREPIAVIQDATTEKQKYAISDVADIVAVTKEQQIGSPAVIVVGSVVKESLALKEIIHRAVSV